MLPMPYTLHHNTTKTVAQPSAGAEWSITVPSTQQWILGSLRALFTASATVANRNPRIVITDASNNVVWRSGCSTNITASQAISIACGDGTQGQAVAGSSEVLTWPDDMVLGPGFVISTSTSALDTGDQWSAIALLVTEMDYV